MRNRAEGAHIRPDLNETSAAARSMKKRASSRSEELGKGYAHMAVHSRPEAASVDQCVTAQEVQKERSSRPVDVGGKCITSCVHPQDIPFTLWACTGPSAPTQVQALMLTP